MTPRLGLNASFAHADALAGGLAARFEHQAVVAALLQAAQIERAVVFVADHEAERVDVERAAFLQVGDAQHDMARARDRESGAKNRIGYGHAGPQARV